MTNEEAKAQYEQAVKEVRAKNFSLALKLLEQLDQERPNSRKVTHQRIVCLIHLHRFDDADKALSQLRTRVSPESIVELEDELATARSQETMRLIEVRETTHTNIFVVEAVYPLSTSQVTITGYMESGQIRAMDSLYIRGTEAPILRLGPTDKPIPSLHEGMHGVMLLGINPSLVASGDTLTVLPAEYDALSETSDMENSLIVDSSNALETQPDKKAVGSLLPSILILLLIIIIIVGLYNVFLS